MSAPAPPGPPRPEIAELTWIAAELERLEESRRQLLARRAFLLAELARPRPPGAPVTSGGPPPPPPRSAPGAGAPRRRREMSRRTVARLLLAAGGALVVIAAAVFTVANWANLGPAGRGAVLLAVTALALAAPWPLARRDLAATAEAAAAIGLALTVADADLGWRLASGAPGFGPGSASLACAALAAAWAAYGGWAPVRGPRLAATGLAQFPLPLAAAATLPGAGPVALALAATAGGDLILATWAALHGPGLAALRRTGCLAAVVTWAAAVVTAAGTAVTAPAGRAPWAAVAFMLAGAVGIAGARMRWLPGGLAGLVTGSCGVLLAAGPALLVAPGLPAGWRATAFAGGGAAIATAGWWARPLARPAGRAVRDLAGPVAAGGAAVLGATGLAVLPGALSALWYPLAWAQTWAGPAISTRAGRAPWVVWHGWPSTPVVLALAALACWLGPAAPPVTRGAAARSNAWPVAVALTALAVGSVPVAVGMPGWAALVTLTALAVAALAAGSLLAGGGVAGTGGGVAITAAVTGLLVAVSAALWSLTGPAVTLVELATLTAICAVTAGLARPRMPRSGVEPSGGEPSGAEQSEQESSGEQSSGKEASGDEPSGEQSPEEEPSREVQSGVRRCLMALVRRPAVVTSVLSLCALVACAALAAGLPAWQAGLAALAVVAVAQGTAAWLARPHPELSLAIELAGWAAAVAAAAPGLRGSGHASVVLTVTGTLCLCVALRPGRRFLLWPGLAQGEAALCVWLVSAGVHAPEPYTLPAAAVLLAAGWQRSRRSPRLSSWACYGPGLALLLLPSLVAVWLLPGWVRPLLLGLAAAGIALAGGRARLLAPLLLGAATVVLDAGHELAPAVQQLAGMLPRWVPIAVIGLVLLAVGATYEARLRDLGRLRAALGRMR
jgi:hypothetical protein